MARLLHVRINLKERLQTSRGRWRCRKRRDRPGDSPAEGRGPAPLGGVCPRRGGRCVVHFRVSPPPPPGSLRSIFGTVLRPNVDYCYTVRPSSPLGCSAPSPPRSSCAARLAQGSKVEARSGRRDRVRAWDVRAPLGVRDFISPCVSCRLRSSGSDPGFHPHPSSHLRPCITAGATHTGRGLVFLAPLQTAPNKERVSSALTQCNIYKMATPTPACDFYYFN